VTEDRNAGDENRSFGRTREYDVGAGIGIGRSRDVTPLIRAQRLSERLEALGRPPLSAHQVQQVAQVLAREEGYRIVFDRPDRSFWRDVLEPMLPKIPRAVAHCFTGEHESLREYLAMGLWIGITGWICDERRGKHLHDIVADVPDDRLMIETDAPYLLPRTIEPKPKTRRNEPAYLAEVLRVVAEARGQSEEHVARITTENAVRFFDLN
jgi:Tat protein secretion system quality control protein TatD with DNase activity